VLEVLDCAERMMLPGLKTLAGSALKSLLQTAPSLDSRSNGDCSENSDLNSSEVNIESSSKSVISGLHKSSAAKGNPVFGGANAAAVNISSSNGEHCGRTSGRKFNTGTSNDQSGIDSTGNTDGINTASNCVLGIGITRADNCGRCTPHKLSLSQNEAESYSPKDQHGKNEVEAEAEAENSASTGGAAYVFEILEASRRFSLPTLEGCCYEVIAQWLLEIAESPEALR
jgi:hypothetical protein